MLTQERLIQVLSYDLETGIFKWRKTGRGHFKANGEAGYNSRGYIIVRIDTVNYLAHRLAFLYVEGYWPEHDVDHINGTKNDNSWNNLRHVTRTCNLQNQHKVQKNNKSGYTGVFKKKNAKKWYAYAAINKRLINLGYHDTALDAALARITFEDWCPEWKCGKMNENRKKVFADLRAGG